MKNIEILILLVTITVSILWQSFLLDTFLMERGVHWKLSNKKRYFTRTCYPKQLSSHLRLQKTIVSTIDFCTNLPGVNLCLFPIVCPRDEIYTMLPYVCDRIGISINITNPGNSSSGSIAMTVSKASSMT